MTKVILSGCRGRMGRVIAELVQNDSEIEIVAGFDPGAGAECDFPVYANPMEYSGTADCVIDFSSPLALDDLLRFCTSKQIPAVLATTGYSTAQIDQIQEASTRIPIFRSANMSVGINVMIDLVRRAAAALEAMNAAPIDDSYVAIIHPYAAYDLMRCPEWMDAHKYASPDNIYAGEIGKIGNVRFVKSTEAKIWKGDGCPEGLAVFSTLVLGASAYGVTEVTGGGLQHIVKQLGYGEDPLNQRSSCGWKATRAAKRLVEEYMVRIESCSAYSATAEAN